MNRTAIYARTACPNGAELNRQVQVLQGLAVTLNLNVTYIIRETASGLDFERRGLQIYTATQPRSGARIYS